MRQIFITWKKRRILIGSFDQKGIKNHLIDSDLIMWFSQIISEFYCEWLFSKNSLWRYSFYMLSLSSTYLLFTNEVKVLSGRLEKLQVNQADLLENNLLSWFHESLEKLRLKRLKWWNLISFYKTLPRNHFKKSFHHIIPGYVRKYSSYIAFRPFFLFLLTDFWINLSKPFLL